MSSEPPRPKERQSAGPITRWLSGRSTRSARPPEPAEIDGFRRAQSVAFECAQATATVLRPGWTESQAGGWMTNWLHEHGVRAHLHKPIVAFGARTLAPAGEWGPSRDDGAILHEGDVAILDCAPIVDGFTGDIAYTLSVGHHAELDRARAFLSDLRARLPERFVDPDLAREVFGWVDAEIRAAGYDNASDGYVNDVMGHRVYRHGRRVSQMPWFLPETPFGWVAGWHGPAFLAKTVARGVHPETLGPLHHGPKTGVWAIEPHVRAGTFGAKFEELLVVEPDRAYWLDDTSQRRMTVGLAT